MIFLFILIFGVVFLFVNVRNVAPGTKGSLIAGATVVLLPLCFLFRTSYISSLGMAFLSVWLSEALLVYILWWIARGIRRFVVRKPMDRRLVVSVSRLLLFVSVVMTIVIIAMGVGNNENFKVREFKVAVPTDREFTAMFFSDLHIDPLFNREKMERIVHVSDSLHPDFVLFGGDFADVVDSTLSAWEYDFLAQKLAATAKVAAVAIDGNHEGFVEREGSDYKKWMQDNGFVVLEDSTVCADFVCITGRVDHSVAKIRDVERKPLFDLRPSIANAKLPWLLLDHQPRGIEDDYVGRRPDFAMSGHTHNGQFFPGTVIINWVWRLAYGIGELDEVKWLVSSGVDSWGPPVRVGSETEVWFLRFVPDTL
jgi:hypothetical protein